MDNAWDGDAKWIWHPSYDDTRNPGSIVLFRREFNIERVHKNLTVNVTADSRYRLFLNGRSISSGPCKGTPSHWYYEVVDVSNLIRPGTNILAAQVLRYSPAHRGNSSVRRSRKPGFVLLLKGREFNLPTDLSWRCTEDNSLHFHGNSAYDWFLATNETSLGPNRQFGWEEIGFNDEAWLTPIEITNEYPGIEFSELPWSLFPRPIPQLTETPRRFKEVVCIRKAAEGVAIADTVEQWTSLLRNQRPMTIPPFQEVEVDVQAREYSTGYLQFAFEHGRGAQIKHLSAESYELTPRSKADDKMSKGNRLDFEKGHLNGQWDEYTVAGRDIETYEPFWFRAFRFLRLRIQTREQPLIVTNISYRETNFPLTVTADFTIPAPSMFSQFWDVPPRTLKNCMHETYEDCPYYEQTQYTFDTRIQILLTYVVSGDDRLPRKAIHDFHSTLRPNGLLGFRCPSHVDIVVPGFSLFFPLIIHDHYMYIGDRTLVEQYLPTIEAILNAYQREIGPLGLISRFHSRLWSYVDWVDAWKNGIPDAARVGPVTYFSLVYAMALNAAKVLASETGRHDLANMLSQRKEAIINAVNEHCFDGTWYYDGPLSEETPAISQHCQIYAILSDTITGQSARSLLLRTIQDRTIHQVSLSQAFYLFRALEKTDLYNLATGRWDPWKTMLDQGLDTWAETLHNPRSDCHAWSAAPLYEITSMILGVKPNAPGFKIADVRPALETLSQRHVAIREFAPATADHVTGRSS
ncbi:hypothetical protein QWA68_015085 [Fusarium oxysporum]|nr:hypothetical protein QWA68_015085 [Fusarium oxysporum]